MQTVTISVKTFEKILSRLDLLTQEVKTIKAKLFKKEPSYGSDVWWNKDIEKAEKEFKKGKGIRFESVKDAVKWLNS